MRPNFFNENAHRAYPFVPKTVGLAGTGHTGNLPFNAIVDAGFLMGALAAFNASTNSVWLQSIRRAAFGPDEFFFVFATDAAGLAGSYLVFTRTPGSGYQTQHIWSEDVDGMPPVSESCDDPLWSGYLATGSMSTLMSLMNPGDVWTRSPGQAVVEPALIQDLSGSFVTGISVANADRTRVSAAPDCPPISWPYPIDVDHIVAKCLQGDIAFKEGYNFRITEVPGGNGFQMAPDAGAGLGQPCAEIPLFPGETPPAGSILLSGGPTCNDTVRSLAGLGGPQLEIRAGTGFVLTPLASLNTLVVDVALTDLLLCGKGQSEQASEILPYPNDPPFIRPAVSGKQVTAYDLLFNPDDTLVTIGSDGIGSVSKYIQPYNKLDMTFGTAGTNTNVVAATVGAIDSQGRIYAAGDTGGLPTPAVLRLLPNGQPDHSWGAAGVVQLPSIADFGGFLFGISILDNGNVAVSGSSFHDIDGVTYRATYALLDSAGNVLQSGFPAVPGVVQPNSQNGDSDALGNMVLAGQDIGPSLNAVGWRVTPAGIVDTSFNGGSISINFGGAYQFFLGVEVGASKITFCGMAKSGPRQGQACIFRCHSDGTPDTSFGSGGKVIAPTFFPSVDNGEAFTGIATLTDGRVVCTGGNAQFGGVSQAIIAVFKADGSGLDHSFHGTGFVITNYGQHAASGAAAVQLDNGTIMVAGPTFNSDFSGFGNFFAFY